MGRVPGKLESRADSEIEQEHTDGPPPPPSDAMGGEIQALQVSHLQNPQMNTTNTMQPVPYPPQSSQPLPLQQSPQPHAFPQGLAQPQNFGAGMHGYQAPQQLQFPAAGGGYQGVSPSPHKPPVAAVSVIAMTPVPVNAEYWRSGLFDCLNDPTTALVTFFFPCITFGQVAEIVDRGNTSCGTSGLIYVLVTYFTGLPWLISCTYRAKLRSMFGLPESPAPDWIVHCLCEPCAICQEYRELQARGLDPSIGWTNNIAKNQNNQTQYGVMVPPGTQTMMA